jgi:hypothetical protein
VSIDELSTRVDETATDVRDASGGVDPPAPDVADDSENNVVDLARIGWLATVVACLIAVVILALQGYYGYAGVTLAVAISAAINLT